MRSYFLILLLAAVTLSCAADEQEVTNAVEEKAAGEGIMVVNDFDADLKYAQVVEVKTTRENSGSWRFDVTVRHEDEGWDHYADRWQVVNPDTLEEYGERILAHPHDTEQPFTRSLGGIEIPNSITTVLVRARCKLHDYKGKTILVQLSPQ